MISWYRDASGSVNVSNLKLLKKEDPHIETELTKSLHLLSQKFYCPVNLVHTLCPMLSIENGFSDRGTSFTLLDHAALPRA